MLIMFIYLIALANDHPIPEDIWKVRAGLIVFGLKALGAGLVLSWTAWRLRKPNHIACNLVFIVILTSGCVWQWQTHTQFKDDYTQAQRVHASLPPGQPKPPPPAHPAAAKIDEVPVILERVGAVIASEAEAFKQNFYITYDAFDKSGGFRFRTLSGPEDIQNRRKLLNEFDTANQELLEFFNGLMPHLREMLKTEGVDEPSINTFLDGFNKNGQIDKTVLVRQADARANQAAHEIFNLLEEHWGRWVGDQQNQSMMFMDNETLTRYEQLTSRFLQAITEKDKFSKQLGLP
jgi:hypothetical protein